MIRRRGRQGCLALVACALSWTLPLAAEENNADGTRSAAASTPASTNSDIDQLKAMLMEQQRQIDELRRQLADQKSATTAATSGAAQPAEPSGLHKNLGEVASTTPVVPGVAASASAATLPTTLPITTNVATQAARAGGTARNPCEENPEGPTPAFIRLGSTCLVPIGFMDMTAVWRDKNTGSSIGSNFGSVPYNNTVNGKLSEFRFSPQNSRIGFRFDGDWKGTHFIGYNEFDFLGTSASLALTVTNGAFVPRLRLFWVDVRNGSWEFLGGQSWSMLTPNRRGISALPGDLFYSQVIDVNYMAGLTWTRQPGFRVLYHAGPTVTFGLSAENPDQYVGGSGGSGVIVPPANIAVLGTQVDNAPSQFAGPNTVLTIPTLHPDFIAKIAFDPTARFHGEITGIERTFKIINPNNLFLGQTNTKAGGGIQVGLNGAILPSIRLITTNYWSEGGGRYLFGEAPDLIVRADGSLSLVHSGGTVDGFEATLKNTLLYGYYGGIFIGRNVAIDTNGSKIGYGFTGSANSQDRAINEVSFGFNQTMWRDPRYGAINLMGQYEWLSRNPWFVAAGAPKGTHDNAIYINLRYTLPGAMPNF